MEPSGRVRIVLSLDSHHTNAEEMAVTTALSKIDPKENIVCLLESRLIETKELNQYSIELLASDNKLSTSTALQLLMDSCLVTRARSYLGDILAGIYTDPYLKLLFEKDHFASYSPQKKGFCEEGSSQAFSLKNLAPEHVQVINLVKALFRILDDTLPHQPVEQKERFFEAQIKACLAAITPLKWEVMSYIAEALAVIKIEQVQKTNPKGELTLDDVKELLYGPEGLSGTKLTQLTITMRSKFQVEKIIRVISQVLLSAPQKEPPIFVVRVGADHKDDLLSGLQKQFGNDSIRVVDLLGKPLKTMIKLIKC